MNTTVYNAVITEEDGGYVALNPEYDVASQGSTVEEALKNLQEALSLYLEELDSQNKTHKPHHSYLTTFNL